MNGKVACFYCPTTLAVPLSWAELEQTIKGAGWVGDFSPKPHLQVWVCPTCQHRKGIMQHISTLEEEPMRFRLSYIRSGLPNAVSYHQTIEQAKDLVTKNEKRLRPSYVGTQWEEMDEDVWGTRGLEGRYVIVKEGGSDGED